MINSLFPLTTRMFPDCPNADERNRLLHYYIAHQKRKELGVWLNIVKIKFPEFIDAQDPIFKLRPLAVAVMARDVAAVRTLYQSGADLKRTYSGGWSLVHISMLQEDGEMTQFLEEASKTHNLGLETLTNAAGLTPKELIERTQVRPASENERVFEYRNDQGEIVSGSAAEFAKMTRAAFTRRILATPQALAMDWVDLALTDTEIKNPVNLYAQQYSTLLKGKLPEDAPMYVDKSEKAGYCVRAKERIPKGSFITLYAGKLRTERDVIGQIENEYAFGEVNARYERNIAGLMNDSMPVAQGVTVYHLDGIGISTVVIATDDIEKDEEITINYGAGHNVKTYHGELKLEKLEAFFRTRPIEGLVWEMQTHSASLASGRSPDLELMKLSDVFEYIKCTPDALLYLLLKEIVTYHQLVAFLTPSPFVAFLTPIAHTIPPFQKGCTDALLKFFKFNPLICPQMRAALLEVNATQSIGVTQFVLRILVSHFEQAGTAFDWDEEKMLLPDQILLAEHTWRVLKSMEEKTFEEEAYLSFLSVMLSVPPDSAIPCLQQVLAGIKKGGFLANAHTALQKNNELLLAFNKFKDICVER